MMAMPIHSHANSDLCELQIALFLIRGFGRSLVRWPSPHAIGTRDRTDALSTSDLAQ